MASLKTLLLSVMLVFVTAYHASGYMLERMEVLWEPGSPFQDGIVKLNDRLAEIIAAGGAQGNELLLGRDWNSWYHAYVEDARRNMARQAPAAE
ncbi:hypothetical protein NDA16_002063 [Ustilago loliicola]|nr:hypothetical protein NDA16_002063 [Ustilago loliicola]